MASLVAEDWGVPGGDCARPSGAAVVVLTPGVVPTTDYYLAQRARRDPGRGVRWIDTLAQRADEALIPPGADVLLVRHAPHPWLRLLRAARPRLGRIAWLVDDDMPGALRSPELPLGYALRTALRFRRTRAALAGSGACLLVSTPELVRRAAAAAPRLIAPVYPGDAQCPPGPALHWFYHATAAHMHEIRWLLPVVRAVQQAVPEARFEIVGGPEVRRLYRDVPRVRVRPPLPWPAYRALAATQRFGLGVAPCLPSRFNAARSHVKMFEITRFGAAGVYAARTPYADVIEHDGTGWLCGDSPGEWVERLVEALRDAAGCARVHAAALAWCLQAGRESSPWP